MGTRKGLLVLDCGNGCEGKMTFISRAEEQHSAAYPLDVTVGPGFVLLSLALPEPKCLARKNCTIFSSSLAVYDQHLIKASWELIFLT